MSEGSLQGRICSHLFNINHFPAIVSVKTVLFHCVLESIDSFIWPFYTVLIIQQECWYARCIQIVHCQSVQVQMSSQQPVWEWNKIQTQIRRQIRRQIQVEIHIQIVHLQFVHDEFTAACLRRKTNTNTTKETNTTTNTTRNTHGNCSSSMCTRADEFTAACLRMTLHAELQITPAYSGRGLMADGQAMAGRAYEGYVGVHI